MHELLRGIHSLCKPMCMTEQPSGGVVPEWDVTDRLRKALKHAELGPGDMAAELGVSRNTVTNYLNGHTRIPGPALRLWAIRTGVPREWLETGKGPGGGGGGGGQDDEALRRLTEAKLGRRQITRRRAGASGTHRYPDAA